jgi:Rrf2 family iron-responsive transcriptional regulator
MRLSKQSNYAVRALMYCAVNQSGLSRIGDIGRAFGVSEMFLFKILMPVAKSGLLETVRGRNGGVRLGRPAHLIKVLDVLKVTEENFHLTECAENGCATCPLGRDCAYEGVLGRALAAFFEVLASHTIADLVDDSSGISVALGIDTLAPRAMGSRWSARAVAAQIKT